MIFLKAKSLMCLHGGVNVLHFTLLLQEVAASAARPCLAPRRTLASQWDGRTGAQRWSGQKNR